jgi:glycosyltransferase involved in cell wall biosynthesis
VRLNWINYLFLPWDGYGRYGLSFVRALSELGAEVYPGTIHEVVNLPTYLQRLKGLTWDKLTVALMPGHEFRPLPGRQWGYSMFESTCIPDGWAENINRHCERLLVPCQDNAAVFAESGVEIPIDVIPGGVDTAEFPLPLRPHKPAEDRPYTFMVLGDRGSRKGIEETWMAFYRAFDGVQDVRLIVKTRRDGLAFFRSGGTERRVSIWREDVTTMRDVYAQADCFVFPSRYEGWGLPPREAAAMAVPTIVSDNSGLSDGINHWATRVVAAHRMAPHPLADSVRDGLSFPPESQWFKPCVDELVTHMRWCYENRAAAAQQAYVGAQWLRNNQTWEHAALKLIDLIEEHG